MRPKKVTPASTVRSIMIYSGKGGVGKTTTTVNLANTLVSQGKKVYILDADVNTPSCHVLLGDKQDVKEGLRFNSLGLSSEGFMILTSSLVKQYVRASIKDIKKFKPDYILIDTPPSITDTHINLISTIDVSGVIIVTQPTKLSAEDTARTIGFFNANSVPVVGYIDNMAGKIFNDKGASDVLGLKKLATIPLDRKLQDTLNNKTHHKGYRAVAAELDDIKKIDLDKYRKENLLKGRDVTESYIDGLMKANDSLGPRKKVSHLKILKFYNVETWEYVVAELERFTVVPGYMNSDKFLDQTTPERIERLLEAFEGDDTAYFMVREISSAPGSLFPGELGEGSLDLESTSYYSVPKIHYKTGSETVTLLPHEIIPVSYKDVAALTADGYMPVGDGRLIPPKEAIIDLVESFGRERIWLDDNWEARYDALVGHDNDDELEESNGPR